MTRTPLAFAAIAASLAMPAHANTALISIEPQPFEQRANASTDRLEVFTPRVRDTQSRIDYSYWGDALGHMVIGMGPSQRIPARRVNTTARQRPEEFGGALTVDGHMSRIRFEGSRIPFSFFTDEVGDSLTEYRRDLERVGTELDIPSLSRNEQLAFWLNLHNVAIIEQIAAHYPVGSPAEIRIDGEPLDTARFLEIDGVKLSPRDIRTRIVYPNWSDPRVVYGFFRGEIGGPQIQPVEFNARNLHIVLDENAYEFINSLRGVEKRGRTLLVSRIYEEAAPFYFTDFKSDLLEHFSDFTNDDVAEDIARTERIAFSRYWIDIADLARGRQIFERRLIRTYDPDTGELVGQQVLPAHIGRYLAERSRKLEYLKRTGQRLWTIRLTPVDLPDQPAQITEIE